ncbi:hypothetical protein AAA294_03670 [Fusobacterium varium]|uniref:hypothetical protein n=1 Tax=Fusobacterium varium TaxID=856 RepID=UPI000E48904B|nr:hypothetical protein [Fusobacterium varium]RHG37058.1 hypothetical protein DW261_03990 [Fusobacterium varium]
MAFTDWTTIANYNQALYKTRASENFEFIISSSFKEPVFMVFWNGIKYNGTIVGLSPVVSKVSGTRYKVDPYVITPSKLARTMALTANVPGGVTQYIVGNVPATRKISFAGFLYPTRGVGTMSGTVDIEVINPQNESVIQKFSRVNMSGTSYMGSYWWFYAVPQQYYGSGVALRYTLTHTRGTACIDSFAITIESDLKWIDNGSGGLASDGYNKALVDDAELTILVLERGVKVEI